MSAPLITASTIEVVPDLIASASNYNVVGKVFEAAGLPERCTTNPGCFVPMKSVVKLYDEAARVIGERNLGLFLAPHLTVSKLGNLGSYVLGATTLKEAMFRNSKAMKLRTSHGRISTAPCGDDVAFMSDLSVSNVVGYRHTAVWSALLLISVVRAYTGANWHPLRVDLDISRPPSSTPYEDVFRCPVIFDRPRIAVIIERHALNNGPVLAAGRKTVTYSDLRRIAERPAPTDLVSIVREIIRLRLLDGDIDIDGIARHLELGPRTLQRRLNDEGTAFRALVSQVRAERALEMLRETEAPMIDIAIELGYSSSSHFTRAFRKAVGRLPSDIRRDALAGDCNARGFPAAARS